jgi:hypothetical protein
VVSVTLEMDETTYESAMPQLDEIVAKFDLISHVRRSG